MIQKIGFGSGFTHIGFGVSSPKLQADFTTETYKADGAVKSFADLFTFTRAGKAWLVKDTGLQEYTADVPRFDDGLLIEQSATNLLNDSLLKSDESFKLAGGMYSSSEDTLLGVGKAYTLLTSTPVYLYKFLNVRDGREAKFSMYLSKDNNSEDIIVTHDGTNADALALGGLNEESSQVQTAIEGVSLYSAVGLTQGDQQGVYNKGLVRYSAQNTRQGNIQIRAMQFEDGNKVSSLIITDSTPVTRAADFLSSKITGTTVTGDWDSTLNLSIVAGQLVHSGYGRIRSLEIN